MSGTSKFITLLSYGYYVFILNGLTPSDANILKNLPVPFAEN
jgi:hypothetical protein